MQKELTVILLFITSFISAQQPSWLEKSSSINTFTSHSFHASTYFDNHFYWTGDFWRDICFGGECIELNEGSDVANSFFLKTDTEGNVVGLWHFESSNYLRIQDIAVNPVNESLILVGNYRDDLTFGTFTSTSISSSEGFVMEISKDGEMIWFQRVESLTEFAYSVGTSVGVDSQGNIYSGHVTGGLVQIGDFQHENMGETIATLIVKMNKDGEVLKTQYWVGDGFEQSVDVLQIEVLSGDRIVFGGDFLGDFEFADETMEGSNTGLGFIIVEDADLNPVWYKKFDGIASNINDVLVDENRIIVSIAYNTTVNVNGLTVTGTGSWRETVLALFDEDGELDWAQNFTLTQFSGNSSIVVRDVVKSNGKYWLGGLYQDYANLNGELILSNQNAEGSDFQFPFLVAINDLGELEETYDFEGTQGPGSITVTAGSESQVVFGGEFFSILQWDDFNLSTVNSTLFFGSLGETISNIQKVGNVGICEVELSYANNIDALKLEKGELVKGHIFDAAGRLVETFGNLNLGSILSLNNLHNGIYFLQVECPEGRVGTFKFVKK